MYKIVFARSATKEVQSLPTMVAERILDKIGSLAESPRPSGCKKLQGRTDLWRIRIGEYRVIYNIDDLKHVIDVSVVRHRSEAYR